MRLNIHLMLAVLLAATILARGADEPIAVGTHAQLFLDDRVVERTDNLKRTVHQPVPHPANPVLTTDKPWEFTCVTLWGTVLYDEQDRLFKMWYQTWGNLPPPAKPTFVCYATSTDGLKWDKPDLGIVPFNGDPHTNIVLAPQTPWLDSPTVVKDLADPDPAKRYKMAFCESAPDVEPGIWHATSPDGIRWTRMPRPVVRAGDRNSMFYDTGRKQWVVITRKPGYGNERTVGFAEGDEFGKYGPMRLVFRKDEKDPAESDLYSMPTFMYEGVRIGCVEVYEHATGREITQLAWSHDGEHWQRDPERQPFMLWGEPPAFDWARRTPHNGPPIVREDKLWIYFGGRSTLKRSPDPRRIVGAIGLATLRLDGFCSRDAGDTQATLLTKPLRFEKADALMVNADVQANGSMTVELLDDAGTSIATSEPVRGDNVRHPIRLNGASLAACAGRPVRLKFTMRNAELYSFRFR